MIDRREAILSRLFEIVSSNTAKPFRNEKTVSASASGAINLVDGDEGDRGDQSGQQNNRGRPGTVVQFITMTPAIVILAQASSASSGTAMNTTRAALLGAVLADETLKTAIGSNGDIRYTGCTFENDEGQKSQARLTLNFSITYLFKASDLVGS